MRQSFPDYIRLIFLILALHFFGQSANAQIYTSSVARGSGQAGRAAIVAGDVSFLNPAGLVHLRGRSFLFSRSQNSFAAALTENSPDTIMPASMSYVKKLTENNRQESVLEEDMRVSLADFGFSKWAFGITPHYYQVRIDEDVHWQQTNMDAGMLFALNDNWGMGIVAYDFLKENPNLPEEYRFKTKTGVGINYIFKTLTRFRFDVLSQVNNNFNNPNHMFGYESYINKWIIARFGYRREELPDLDFGSLGLGLELPKFSLDYAFEAQTSGEKSNRHSIDLVLTF